MSATTYNLEIWGKSFNGGPQGFSINRINPVNMGSSCYAAIKNPSTGKYLANVDEKVKGQDASGDS